MKKILSALFALAFTTSSVAQTLPSPTFNNVTVQGNLNLSPKAANQVFASPNGSAGSPTFRSLVDSDIPSIGAGKITSGTLPIARGGTGAATAGANTVFAGPSDGSGAPAFRSLAEVDIPALTVAKITGLQAALDAAADRANHTGTQPISTVSGLQAALDDKAPLASPALTGVPTAPTAAVGTNTTQIATTAFVLANGGGGGGVPSNMVTTDTTQTITGTKTFSQLNIDGAAGTNRLLNFKTGGSQRWIAFATSTAEGGSNAGSDFRLQRYDDAGALLGSPMFIRRSDGQIGINNTAPASTLDIAGTLTASGATTLGSLNALNIGRPADFWTGNNNQFVSVSPNGWIGHNGSNATTIANNYYRNTSAQSPVMNGGAQGVGAAGIDLRPDGIIHFRQSPSWNGVGTAPPIIYEMNPTAPSRGDRTSNVATTAFVQANKGRINPRDYGAACDGTTNDYTALNNALSAASTAASSLQIDCNMAVNNNITLSRDVIMEGSGAFTVGSGATITFTRSFSAGRNVAVFAGSGNINLSAAGVWEVSACWWGGCSGAADVAANLRRLFNSGMDNKKIVFPGGNYNLCSTIPVGTTPYNPVGAGSGQVGYPAWNASNVILKGLTGFSVDAESYGLATFTTNCDASAQNLAFSLDSNTDFEWKGGAFVGRRTGLATTTVNAPFGLVNNQRFKISKTRAVSGYYDAGAHFEGDFNTDFVIEDNMGTVGQGIDMAFSCNGVYRNNRFMGDSSDAANIGIKGFSHIYDGPLLGYGTTSCSEAYNVSVEDNKFDNFVSGIVIQNGTKWRIKDNLLMNIKGATGSPASGILMNYQPTGSFANVGHVPSDVSILGNQIDGLGATLAGCFVNIGANAIANADVFNHILIDGNSIAGTASSSGICSDTNSGAKVANLFVGINSYRNIGSLMNANANALDLPATLPR